MLRCIFRIERLLRWITVGAGGFAGVVMVIMIALVFANVTGRYVFDAGTVWAQELELYLMSVMAMIGIAYAMFFDDHVRVDIFSTRFSRVGRLWLNMLTALLVALPCALLIMFYGFPYAQESFLRGETSPNSSGLPYLYIPKGMVVVGFVFVATESLRQVLAYGRRLVFHYRWGG